MNKQFIEVMYSIEGASKIASMLEGGNVIILRDVLPIKAFRQHLIEISCAGDDDIREELLCFYETAVLPSLPTIYALRCGIQIAQSSRLLSQFLAPLVKKMGFSSSILLDSGISRLVLPRGLLDKIRDTEQYDSVDFLRDSADGPTETFMIGAANIHRDFNRVHHLFQCNIWFPMHNADTDEVLRIWPELYRSDVLDMDVTPDNLHRLGSPVNYKLNFGDAIIFHGEHLHTSPVCEHGAQGYRRHTFDFRIATQCGDDNSGYRYNFCNLNNFIALGNASLPEIADNTTGNYIERFNKKMDSANYYLLALENRKDLVEKDFSDMLTVFLQYPFAEDRYFTLMKKALEMGMDVIAVKAAEQIKTYSPHYFWLFGCGKTFENYEMDNNAQELYRRCYEVLSTFIPKNTMPVEYVNGSNELLAEDVLKIVTSKLNV